MVTTTSLWRVVLYGPARLLWPCFVSPRLSSRGSPPFPSSPLTFPAQALRETFRGLQQTVRLLGASDVGRVGGGRSGAGRGLGRLCPPWTPHSSAGHPAGEAVGGTHRLAEGRVRADGGGLPLLTALPGLPSAP